MGTAAASAGAAGPSEGQRAGRSSGRTEAGVPRGERTMFGCKQYTDLGYNSCDSTKPTLPLQISSSVAKEHENTAHGMWIMAEISGRSRCLYLLPD